MFFIKTSVTDKSDVYIIGEDQEENKIINIRMFFHIDKLCDAHLEELNKIVQRIIEKYLSGINKTYTWYFTFIISVNNETKTFHNILLHSIFQKEGIYRLPVGFSRKKNVLYVAKQEDTYGINEYTKMRKALFQLLEIPRVG